MTRNEMEARASEIVKNLISGMDCFRGFENLPLKSQVNGLAIIAHMVHDTRVEQQMLGIYKAIWGN